MQLNVLPIFFAIGCIVALAIGQLVLANLINPGRPGGVKRMPYERGLLPAA
jgi:NADH:ubiquinone oxidoreductase subunit 3 (subunit A)